MPTITLDMPRIGHQQHEAERDGAVAGAMRSGELGSVHSWELVTAVDGPGTRLTYFPVRLRAALPVLPEPGHLAAAGRAADAAQQVTDRIDQYAPVLKATHGGVTLSGGEPLVQPAFVARIFRHCRSIGVHTALDTSGFLGARADDALLDDTDLVLLDVKSGLPETYLKVTGRESEPDLGLRPPAGRAGQRRSGFGSCWCPG